MKNRKSNSLDLTTGSVWGKYLSFVLPILASNLLQNLYNAADKAVVGQYAGDHALAAVGSTGSAINLLICLFTGLAIGANVVCANMRGARNMRDLRRAMHTAILLAAITGVAVAVIGMSVTRPFLQLMSSPPEVIDLATVYMRIYFVGVPFSLLYNYGAGILRAYGDTKRPMIILALSGLVNVGFNLVFVIFCGMDVDGVAWATVISQMVAAVVVLWILFKPDGGYDLNIRELKIHKRELITIVKVGLPCGFNGMVFSFSNVIIQSSVNSLGDLVVAGNVAADSVTALIYQVIASCYSANVSFSGQCFGARNYKRIDRMLVVSVSVSVGIIALLALLGTLFPNVLMGLFTSSEAVMQSGYSKLMIVSWGYLIYCLSENFMGALRGMRRSTVPTLINVLGVCLPRILWVAFAFPLNRTVGFLYLCYPISWVLSSLCQGLYFFHVRRLIKKENLQEAVSVIS